MRRLDATLFNIVGLAQLLRGIEGIERVRVSGHVEFFDCVGVSRDVRLTVRVVVQLVDEVDKRAGVGNQEDAEFELGVLFGQVGERVQDERQRIHLDM